VEGDAAELSKVLQRRLSAEPGFVRRIAVWSGFGGEAISNFISSVQGFCPERSGKLGFDQRRTHHVEEGPIETFRSAVGRGRV